jgi:hypothetical protein
MLGDQSAFDTPLPNLQALFSCRMKMTHQTGEGRNGNCHFAPVPGKSRALQVACAVNHQEGPNSNGDGWIKV